MEIINVALIGMACGIVPLIAGILRRRLEIGTFGFAISIVSALVYNFYFSAFVAFLFTLFLLKPKRGVPAKIIPFPIREQGSKAK